MELPTSSSSPLPRRRPRGPLHRVLPCARRELAGDASSACHAAQLTSVPSHLVIGRAGHRQPAVPPRRAGHALTPARSYVAPSHPRGQRRSQASEQRGDALAFAVPIDADAAYLEGVRARREVGTKVRAASCRARRPALRDTACAAPLSANSSRHETTSLSSPDRCALVWCPRWARINIGLPVVRLPRSTRVTTASARALSPMLPAIHQPLAATAEKRIPATTVDGLAAFLTQTDLVRLSPRHVRTVSS